MITGLDHVQLTMPAGAEDQARVGIEEPFAPARKAHPGLLVDDLGALLEALTAPGFPWTEDASIPGVRGGHTADPFGNRLELMAS